MAELVVAVARPVVEIVAKKLASGLWEEVGPARNVHTDIEKLKNILSTIQDVLDDAERKSITSKPLQGWLRKLRDAAFDADDVVDDFQTEALQRRIERHVRMTGKVRGFFSSNNLTAFRRKFPSKIRKIRERFDEIAREKRDFDLMVKSDSDSPVKRETKSLAVESEIYGRDNEKNEVIQILVDKDNDKNISILPIVGLGGMGKTTLAQIVYHNDRIEKHFELRMWVCVGEKFDEEVVLQKMIVQVQGEPKNSSILETMSSFLQEKLRTKRFLLVLDDLWNEDELEWEKLKPLFVHAKLGSKIIVTTRSERVASITGTIVPPYRLQGLGIEDCWTLFKHRAFRFEREEDNPQLVEIGWEIIEKCGGLPLAAKALGTLMSSKRGKVEWLDIKNNEIWTTKLSEDVVPVLKLSYDHLPSHLKWCFAYCSVFPKDHEFKIERLIQLWMAEGLIDTSGTSQNGEDIGKQYFDNLLSRSFFQDVQMDEYNNPVTCKMHDLVHDLACSMTKDEALVMEGGMKSISHGCRYLSIVCYKESSTALKTIYEAKKLRSLILLGALNDSIVDEFILNVTKSFTRLRALDLSYNGIQKLSDSISKLKHLRFLVLSNTPITTLPISITRLYNLQTFNLRHCNMLTELPEDVGNLCNLRYMDISWCTRITMLPTSITRLSSLQMLNLRHCNMLKELPEDISNLDNLRHLDINGCSSLDCIPPGLGRLSSNLVTLPMFIVAPENGRKIVELQHLNSIRDRLVIKYLHHVKDPKEAMQANLEAKMRLNYLKLEWNEGVDEEQEPSSTEVEVAAGVLERLQPHRNLRELDIRYYTGTRLPNWMSSSFPNLVHLKLWDLKRCEHLPLGRWPSLKYLYLDKLHAVRRIGEEFYEDGGDITFPLLEELDLLDMPKLEIWYTEPTTAGKKIASFPRLTKLRIRSCPKLAMQPCMPCSVETLEIISSNEMLLSARSLAGSSSKLKHLEIVSCGISSSSGRWDGLQYLITLEKLRIEECDELTCLPEHIMYLPFLETLHLKRNKNLSLDMEGRKQQLLNPFTGLRYLKIEGADMLTALPECIGGLTSLQSLQIMDCPKLAMLPDSLQHLTALQGLRIYKCPQLMRRCERERGEDWHKIAHIPDINIGSRI